MNFLQRRRKALPTLNRQVSRNFGVCYTFEFESSFLVSYEGQSPNKRSYQSLLCGTLPQYLKTLTLPTEGSRQYSSQAFVRKQRTY